MNAIWHVRRLAGILAGLAGVLLASAAAVPAAFAGPIRYRIRQDISGIPISEPWDRSRRGGSGDHLRRGFLRQRIC